MISPDKIEKSAEKPLQATKIRNLVSHGEVDEIDPEIGKMVDELNKQSDFNNHYQPNII